MDRKILFVDDEASLRRTMALGLSQRGYDTEPCENGMSALKKLDSYIRNNINLDAIVVDIRLPDIDGIKLVKIIKFKYPGIPIVLITGYADRYNREEIRNLRVSAFLEKPFSPEELSAYFEKIMKKEHTTRPAVSEKKVENRSQSAYLMLRLEDDTDFFETYRNFYYMEDVLYCDATKGDYDIFMLVQADTMEECREIAKQVEKTKGVKSVDFLEVGKPILDDSTASIIDTAEDALSNELTGMAKNRDMDHRVCSYLLMEVEREKLDEIYPTLKLNDNIIFCDYTTGKYNLVIFVTGPYFSEIDRFIQDRIVNMDGVLKIKEYPIVNLFEM